MCHWQIIGSHIIVGNQNCVYQGDIVPELPNLSG